MGMWEQLSKKPSRVGGGGSFGGDDLDEIVKPDIDETVEKINVAAEAASETEAMTRLKAELKKKVDSEQLIGGICGCF